MRTQHFKSLLCIAALMAAGAASAQKVGDNIVSFGLASVNPDANVGALSNTEAYAIHSPYTNTQLLGGTTAHVGSQTTVSFSWLHMFTNEVGAEFTLGIPTEFTQDLTVQGTTHSGAAKMTIWTPTVVGKYLFNTPSDKLRPYVGLGVSRVSFHNVNVHDDGTGLVTALAGTSAALSSSWVPVYNAGMIYNIDDKWSINGSISYLPIKTDVTFVGVAGTTTGTVKLNTTDYVIRLGYRF